MEKTYKKPQLEIVELYVKDIVTASDICDTAEDSFLAQEASI